MESLESIPLPKEQRQQNDCHSIFEYGATDLHDKRAECMQQQQRMHPHVHSKHCHVARLDAGHLAQQDNDLGSASLLR